MAQQVFEDLTMPAIYFSPSAESVICASGRTNAFALEMGHASTIVTPVINGCAYRSAMRVLPIGGRHVTAHLFRQFLHHSIAVSEDCIVNQIKHEYANASNNATKSTTTTTTCSLYDSPPLHIPTLALHNCASDFVQDNALGMAIKQCVDASSAWLPSKYFHIVLAGGTSVLRGMPELIMESMKSSFSHPYFHIVEAPERKYTTWIGQSIIASLTPMLLQWITREEYLEQGDRCVQFSVSNFWVP